MRKWFKIWFVPLTVIGLMVGMLSTTYTPRFTGFNPPPPEMKSKTFEEKLTDKALELRSASKSDIMINGAIGAVIGWFVSKFLDFGLLLIRKRIKQ